MLSFILRSIFFLVFEHMRNQISQEYTEKSHNVLFSPPFLCDFLKSDDLHDNADKMGDYYTSYALEVTNNQTTLVDNLIKKMKRPDFPVCRFRSESTDEVCLRSRCSVREFLVKLDNVQLFNACKSFLVTQ